MCLSVCACMHASLCEPVRMCLSLHVCVLTMHDPGISALYVRSDMVSEPNRSIVHISSRNVSFASACSSRLH
jgi:hypothetical protein